MEFFWFETKTYPIPSHLDASRRSAKTVPLITKQPNNDTTNNARWLLGSSIGWGRTQGKTKTLHSNPVFFYFTFLLVFQLYREGKVTYAPVVLETELASGRAHTHTHTQARSRVSSWHHNDDAIAFLNLNSCSRMARWACMCVWASEPSNRVSSECDEKFSISKWRPTFFRNLCVWVLWWWENVLRTTNDASGDLGFLALWLHVWILHLPRSRVCSLIKKEGNLVPIDCIGKLSSCSGTGPLCLFIGSGKSWYCSVPLWNYWFR